MRAVQKVRPEFGLDLREVPEPDAPLADEVIVSVAATGVCGTDRHIYEWTPVYEAMTQCMPVTLGHEFSGVIASVGSSACGLGVGTRVAVRPAIVCGRCAACLAGRPDDQLRVLLPRRGPASRKRSHRR
jgi:threonine dehydrogenase-like Zn-dependent dehydrogenase